MRFRPKPTQPMIKTSLGFSTSRVLLASSIVIMTKEELTLQRDEPLDGLQEDTDAQTKQKNSIEKGAEQLDSLPAEGECLGRICSLGDLAHMSIG